MQYTLIALLSLALPAVSAASTPVAPLAVQPALQYGTLRVATGSDRKHQGTLQCVYIGTHPFDSKFKAYLYGDCAKVPTTACQKFRVGPETKPNANSKIFVQDSTQQYMYVDPKSFNSYGKIKKAPVVPAPMSSATSPVINSFGFFGEKTTGFGLDSWYLGLSGKKVDAKTERGCVGIDQKYKMLIFGFPKPGNQSAAFCKGFYLQ